MKTEQDVLSTQTVRLSGYLREDVEDVLAAVLLVQVLAGRGQQLHRRADVVREVCGRQTDRQAGSRACGLLSGGGLCSIIGVLTEEHR